MCSNLTKKPERRERVFIVNFEHISHLARHERCQNTRFLLGKRKKSNKLNR